MFDFKQKYYLVSVGDSIVTANKLRYSGEVAILSVINYQTFQEVRTEHYPIHNILKITEFDRVIDFIDAVQSLVKAAEEEARKLAELPMQPVETEELQEIKKDK